MPHVLLQEAQMHPFFYFYIAAWASACLLALALYWHDPGAFSFSRPTYRSFLFASWKLVTFAIAAGSLTLVAPYTGDPTWDYVDALFMSMLTFLSAPWVVGALYLVARRRLPIKQAFVAGCVWMFSASWSYDFYILIRDGDYPLTWLSNIFASSVLYIAAGLLWNLEWKPGRGVTFSFMEEDWPSPSNNAVFGRIFWYALPLMLIAAVAILCFVAPRLLGLPN